MNPDTRPHKRSYWPWLIVAALVAHIGGMAWAVTIATRQKYAVVPDYYRKSVEFDAHKADLARSAALGWTARLDVGDAISDDGTRGVSVRVHDHDGNPVADAIVTATLVHHAVPERPDRVTAFMTEPGVYETRTHVLRPGTWTVDLRIERGGDVMLASDTRLIN
jgi:nitrogen fixation protein FixH